MSFTKLLNFRDVAVTVNEYTGLNTLKPGLLYRSARPDEATAADRSRLVSEYGIRTIIDLRTTTEHIEAAKKVAHVSARTESAALPSDNEELSQPSQIPGVTYSMINLNGKGFERSLVWQLSYFSLFRVISLMAFGYRLDAVSILAREVLQPRGLVGLGIDTIEHSQQEIRELFKLLAHDEAWPVMVHCTQGKDRTGLVVLLILLLCGVDIDAITDDYVKSETELAPSNEERLEEIASIGLDESFAKCPPEFPLRLKQHIDTKYTSIDNYLERIGVSASQIARVKARMAP